MTKKTLKLPLLFALTLALVAVTVPFAFAGDGDDAAMQDSQQEQGMESMDQQHDMQAMREQMMQRHQQMLDEMKQEQSTLDALVEQMKSAQGDAKVDAVAAVLDELVAQHQERTAQRIEMMETMDGMGSMTGHGMAGMHHGGEMMKGHGGHCGGHCDGKAKCEKCPMKGEGMKCENCPMKDGMKCDDCPMKDGMKGDCPMHEKCENCPMHKEMMEKGTMEKGEGMPSDGR